jgi:hypothetical protein
MTENGLRHTARFANLFYHQSSRSLGIDARNYSQLATLGSSSHHHASTLTAGWNIIMEQGFERVSLGLQLFVK